MTTSTIADFYDGIGYKKLSKVEIVKSISNQHEFNGVSSFKKIWGKNKKMIPANFIFFEDEENILNDSGSVTWYDARENHPTRTEYRLYYPENNLISKAAPGDYIIVANRKKEDLVDILIIKNDTTIKNKLFWLFNIKENEKKHFYVKNLDDQKLKDLNYFQKNILELLGIFVEEKDETVLELMLNTFGKQFPKTKVFSDFSMNLIKNQLDFINSPDESLVKLWENEDKLFKILEKYFVEIKLKTLFKDVDDFLKYSLSIQNRRKSRAGRAFENQIRIILEANNIKFDEQVITENKSKPDFLFPGINFYKDNKFPDRFLNMLGVKTTCKDRWRQILSEASRIKHKHLITLEPGISTNQTDEMKAKNVKLVTPNILFETYSNEQLKNILSVKDFIDFILDVQKNFF